MLSIGVLVVDSMVDSSIHHNGVIYVSTQVFTTSGHSAMLANTPFHGMLVIGIAVAMHGVATYAHIYMGYEQYTILALVLSIMVMAMAISMESVVH